MREAAIAWCARTLEWREPEKGIGGFSAWTSLVGPDDPGLLMGAGGVALALLAAAGESTPDWDRAMLLS